jgi:hypothetical protein
MAMRLTGRKGYYRAESECVCLDGEVTVNYLTQRLGCEKYAAFIRGYLFYLFDHDMIECEEAEIVMWTVRREHWLAGFPRSIQFGYRPYDL